MCLIRYFRDVFYSSLPHEIRANLSSLEVFLVGLYSKEEQYLRTELEKTNEWSRYKSLLDFNPNIYLTDLIDRYDINFTIRIFNLFNKILQINTSEIKNEADLIKYFKNWKKYFIDVSKKYKQKINKKLKEVIEDDKIGDKYVIEKHEDSILSYSEYLNDISYLRNAKIEDLLGIDYETYFN